jgi:metal-responsive CopG/Arc/MetJ family transcriptional regulator
MPRPKVYFNWTVDLELLERIEEAAEQANTSRSAWLRDAARAKLLWEQDPEAFSPEKVPDDD